jgi:hypothetical protein
VHVFANKTTVLEGWGEYLSFEDQFILGYSFFEYLSQFEYADQGRQT